MVPPAAALVLGLLQGKQRFATRMMRSRMGCRSEGANDKPPFDLLEEPAQSGPIGPREKEYRIANRMHHDLAAGDWPARCFGRVARDEKTVRPSGG